MTGTNWNAVKELGLPWMVRFNYLISTSVLPSFLGPTIYIVTDFSGYHPASKYEVISLLIVDLTNSLQWEYSRRRIREKLLVNGRRISFKGLHDKRQLNILEPFLIAADNIEGICVNIAFAKNRTIHYINKEIMSSISQNSPFIGKWSYKTLNRMFKIVHLVSIFIAGFCKPHQNICWISDQDDIFANQDRAQDVTRLLSAFTTMFVKFELGKLAVGLTSLDEEDRWVEDLASIPDLAAGALSEYITATRNICGARIFCGLELPSPKGITSKTELIISWIMDNSRMLKKLVILFEDAGGGRFGITRLEIE
jgi:hypothetical protein